MIQFPCTCHHLFSVTDDQSGLDIQCPACGRLNTVPSAADLDLLNMDGTYKVDGPIGLPEPQNPQRAEELKRIFTKSRVDEYGNEIDLRSHATPLDYKRVGSTDPIDLMPEARVGPAPKYDPETGELIRPMEVAKVIAPKVARPALAPSRPTRRGNVVKRLRSVAPMTVWAQMFMPANLVVLGFLLFAHMVYMASVLVGTYLIFIMPLAIAIGLAIIAHFGNVVDETGPSSRDELPRPLRNLSWHDDLWGPFFAFVLTALICYGPSYFTLRSTSITNDLMRYMLAGVFALIGTVIAPAVVLISQTSGSIANLRPDRILNTMRGCGSTYPLLVMLYLVSVPTYLLGFLGTTKCCADFAAWSMADIAKAVGGPQKPSPLIWMICGGALLGGMWLTNFFCWVLGHVYRVYHRQFQWEYQGSLQDDDEPAARGFEVRTAPVTPPPPPVLPQAAIPVSSALTREERLAYVRAIDTEHKKESDEAMNRIPDSRPNTPQF